MGIRMSAIVKEDIDKEIEDFRGYWSSDIYLDGDKAFYKALGGGKVVQHTTAGFIASFANPWSTVNKNIARSKKSGIDKYNMKGEGLITGGIFVLHKGGKVAFAFSEKNIGDHAEMKDVLKACKEVSETAAASGTCSEEGKDGKL